jgi:hypothetical protein
MSKSKRGQVKTTRGTPNKFDRSKHVYKNDAFVELVKDAIRFFNGTPVQAVPPPERFQGTGIYALYYTGQSKIYAKYAELNRLGYDFPIYVGKAVPKGWRQSRETDSRQRSSYELYSRLREHARSINATASLSLGDFACRFMIFEGASSDMIGTLEAAIIKWKRPLWNCYLDGFGNHTPGMGRFEQAPSEWDVVHPGRPWAKMCKGKTRSRQAILKGVESFLANELNSDTSI